MSITDFLALLRDELALPVSAEDADRPLTEIPGWDSVHVLWLLSVLERKNGGALFLPEALQAETLRGIHAAVRLR
jgi:hypothetical protein